MMKKNPGVLFSSTPLPDDAVFIQETFINRNRELIIAEDFQPEQMRNQIYAIHGNSRVGKSHFAIKLALDFAKEDDLIYFYVNANLKGTSTDVLNFLFELIRDYIKTYPEPQDKERSDHLLFLKEYLDQIDRLFFAPTAKILLRNLKKRGKHIKPSFTAKVPLINLGISLAGEQSEGSEVESVTDLERPDSQGVRRILYFLLNIMAFVARHKFLILVDDLDLLEENDGGKQQRNDLVNQLKNLATLEPVAIWVTSRHQYFTEHEKEMIDYIRVTMMKQADLEHIYRKRIKRYNNDESVFDAEVLGQLTEGFKGIIGSFLRECSGLWKRFRGEGLEPLGIEELDLYLAGEMDEFRSDPGTRAMIELIEAAVKNRTSEVVIKGVHRGHGLIYRVLIPLAYEQERYEIIPLFANAIRKQISQS